MTCTAASAINFFVVSNLLKKDNYKLADIVKIADTLNYDVSITFVDRDGNDNVIVKA